MYNHAATIAGACRLSKRSVHHCCRDAARTAGGLLQAALALTLVARMREQACGTARGDHPAARTRRQPAAGGQRRHLVDTRRG